MIPLLPGIVAHPSGALWLPGSRTAIAADVHLGYSWAQRRRGELGPLADCQAERKLAQLVDGLAPATLVFLGDLVHAPRPCPPERIFIEKLITSLAGRVRLVAVRGNHDRAFEREFGHLPIAVQPVWTTEGITAVHGDRLDCAPLPEAHILLSGHLHPSLNIPDASGGSSRVPVFLASAHSVVLPAFSPFARGFDLADGLPSGLLACFRAAPICAYAATGNRVVPIGPLRQALDRISQSHSCAAPMRFRRRRVPQ